MRGEGKVAGPGAYIYIIVYNMLYVTVIYS